jgi:hypothetical protein
MLHFDIEVNGHKIGDVGIRRIGAVTTDGTPNAYDVRVFLDVEGQSRRTTVEHYYHEGPLRLISKAMDAADLLIPPAMRNR